MSEYNQINIQTTLLASVAAKAPQPGRLSPFWPLRQEQTSFAPPLLPNLPGITGETGELSAAASDVFARLSAVEAFVRIMISGSAGYVEEIVYFPAVGSAIAVKPGSEEFVFRSPSPTGDLLAGLAEHLGIASKAMGDFTVEMSAAEAVVLAAVIDLQRKNILTAFAEGQTSGPAPASFAGLQQFLASCTADQRWLTTIISQTAGYAAPLPPESTSAALSSLVKAGLLTFGESGYLPSQGVWELAQKLLLIDRICSVSAGREAPDGTAVVTGFTCVIGGMTSLLYIEAADSVVRWETPSARAVLAEIEFLISSPDALKPLIDNLPVGASISAAFCRNCSKIINPGTKFCSACGTAV